MSMCETTVAVHEIDFKAQTNTELSMADRHRRSQSAPCSCLAVACELSLTAHDVWRYRTVQRKAYMRWLISGDDNDATR